MALLHYMIASAKGCPDIVSDLLASGADVNLADKKRRTALWFPQEGGKNNPGGQRAAVEIIQLLRKQGK